MIIPNITPLPPSPQRTDPSTFAARADASLTAQETVFTPELNAFASAVNVTQGEMTVLSNTAATQAQIATTQAAAAASSALSAGATVWVSGTTYTVGVSRYSPLDGQVYRRMVGGAGTTDPSLDAVNWRVVNGLTSELIVLPFNNLPSMRPSLNLDFANSQAVDPRITFTRASTATRTNSKGLIELVPSGVPRIDFDPITGACKGLLIEEQRTNLLTYSEQFDNAAWTKTRATITANATTAPDGTLTADKLVEDSTASNTHVVYASDYVATNVALTASCYVKAGERTRILMEISNFSTGAATCVFDLATGTAGSPGNGGDYTGTTAIITPLGGGWYRCSITSLKGAFNSSNRVSFSLHNGTSATFTGDGTSGLFIWGAQLEAGAFPTSYTPTVGSQVTRAADVASMTGANFSSWYRQDEGSFIVDSRMDYVSAGSRGPLRVDDGTDSNRLMVRNSGAGFSDYRVITSGASVVNLEPGNTLVPGVSFKHAVAYKSNDFASSFNGGNLLTDTAGGVPVAVTRMILGETAGNGTVFLGGCIRELMYYPKRLTNAELIALSAQ